MSEDEPFERLMGAADGAMYVVTAWADGERSGCLVGFATQASIRPRRFLVLMSKTNHTFRVAERATVLGVHVLHPSDREMAARFGELTSDRVDKFDGLSVSEGPGRVPVIGGLDWFAGRVRDRIDCGDHVAYLLAPHDGRASRADEGPLGFQQVRDLDAGHEA